jgi:hypothetical protein
VVLAAGVLAAACQPAKLRPRLPSRIPTAARLLESLAERHAAVRSVRGFAQIAYESGEENLDTLFSFPSRAGLEELMIEQYPDGGGG